MRNYPLRISVLYFLMASMWIFLSDWVVTEFAPPEYLNAIQTAKGFVFVLVSSVVLYFIALHYYRLIEKNALEYRKLFKDNPHPMWVYDIETLRFLTVNNAAIEKYKYTADEFRDMVITDIRPDEDQDSILMFVRRIESKTYHDSGIWRHRDKSGRVFFVKVTSHSTNFGSHKARVVLAMDVEEQIQSQKRIQLSESKLKGLINNSDDLIWMLDNDGIIVTANEAFQSKFRQFMGFSVELSKKIDVAQLPDSGFTRNWNNYFKLAFLGRRLRVEEEVKNNNKTEYYEIILNPIYNDLDEIIGVGCFARDITLRKETELQIQKQVDTLKEVAWIQSHEVRKPLANILGLLNLLKKGNVTEPQTAEIIVHMETSCQQLDTVIKKVVEKSATVEPPAGT